MDQTTWILYFSNAWPLKGGREKTNILRILYTAHNADFMGIRKRELLRALDIAEAAILSRLASNK